jgi:hypothetical protein
MAEQQISQDEQQKNIIKHQMFSKISFIIFILSFAFYLCTKIYNAPYGDFHMILFAYIFYIPYIIYIMLHSWCVFILYQKILKYNLLSFFVLFSVAILNYTGFCYYKGKYLTKAEQIDIGLQAYIRTTCGIQGWNEKKIAECPYSLKKLKEQYPQCFVDARPDNCELYQYKKLDKTFFDIFGRGDISTVYSEKLYDDCNCGLEPKYFTVTSSAEAFVRSSNL